eukprot:SAG31_NODE_1596_length_7800_cov_4.335801_2_plen_76_part_00
MRELNESQPAAEPESEPESESAFNFTTWQWWAMNQSLPIWTLSSLQRASFGLARPRLAGCEPLPISVQPTHLTTS